MKIKKFMSHFPGTYLQTFDDKGKDKSLVSHGSPKTFTSEKLQDLNQRGAGIFFTPNKFSTRRKADLCEGINSWFMEIDDASIDEQWERVTNAPIMPSLVVKTRNSLHSYYLAEDATKENFTKIQKGLIEYFGADPSCKDISRVLRIPGYYHNKKDPHMVEIVWEAGNKYMEKQMLEAFPHAEKQVIQKRTQSPPKGSLNLWQALSQLDNKLVLGRLSGTAVLKFETVTHRKRSSGGEYIDINGEPADAWIDEHGMIGSGKGGGPTWIQFIEYYGWSKADIANLAKEHLSDLLPVLTDEKTTYEKEEKSNKLEDVSAASLATKAFALGSKQEFLTWGVPSLDKHLTRLSMQRYVILTGETGSGKTAFSFHMAIENAKRGKKVLFLSLEMTNEALLLRYVYSVLNLTSEQIEDKAFTESQFKSIVGGLPPSLNFKALESSGSVGMDTIAEAIIGYDVVFIDNFGYIDEGRETTVNEQMKSISRSLVALRDITGAAIIALHHFRKGGESVKKIRSLDALMGTGKLSHDVDFAIQVARERDMDPDEIDYERKKAELSIIMMKDRDRGNAGACRAVYFRNGGFHSDFDGRVG